MDEIETVVIGAGVVGLAIARALALTGREVLVLEQAEAIGTGASSRNSEVIHAGLYYPTGSVRAVTCVEGKARLYAYCEARGVPFRRCAKLIVATDEAEISRLEAIKVQADANGVRDLESLDAGAARRLEPELVCEAALLSPSTGIVDSHAYMLSLQGDAESAGAMVAFHSPVLGAALDGHRWVIQVGGCEPMTICAGEVVNAAGLFAPDLARRFEGLAAETIPTAWYAKGSYFTLSGRAPFSRLIYPVPVPGGLGVHLTLDLGGQAKFGPDVEWVEAPDYSVDPGRSESFYAAVRRYWPGLKDGALQPGYAGVRPKITPPGAPAQDFVVQGPGDHGAPGLVNLFGVESPGLTASLALADLAVSALA